MQEGTLATCLRLRRGYDAISRVVALSLVFDRNVNRMTALQSMRHGRLNLRQKLIGMRKIVKVDIGEAVQYLMLIECTSIFFAAHLSKTMLMGNRVDITVVGDKEQPRREREECKKSGGLEAEGAQIGRASCRERVCYPV